MTKDDIVPFIVTIVIALAFAIYLPEFVAWASADWYRP